MHGVYEARTPLSSSCSCCVKIDKIATDLASARVSRVVASRMSALFLKVECLTTSTRLLAPAGSARIVEALGRKRRARRPKSRLDLRRAASRRNQGFAHPQPAHDTDPIFRRVGVKVGRLRAGDVKMSHPDLEALRE
eukprot:4133280-Prymnesium_polylepis.2